MKKNKGTLIGIIIATIFLLGAVITWIIINNKNSGSKSDKLVFVNKLDKITGVSGQLDTKFMGVVEPQETKSVEKDQDKTVKEILVKEGDMVEVGTPLFSYDTEQIQLDLESKQLDLDNLKNQIDAGYDTLEDLKKMRDSASGNEKLSYTSQINTQTVEIKRNEYDYSVKKLEYERLEASSKNAAVLSPMAGVVKKINNTDSGNMDDYYGGRYGSNEDSGFITIMATGAYRIKGTATEEDIVRLSEETPVIVRSRVDETKIWRGKISKINREPETSNDNSFGYYGYESSGESSSKYSFYVELEDATDLMLGQHLYIEYDMGQTDINENEVFIPEYYLIRDENGEIEKDAKDRALVWKRDDKGKIRKTPVTLGDYKENSGLYVVKDGLTKDDYIAFPENFIEEGMNTTTNFDESYVDKSSMNDGMGQGGMGDNTFTDENGNTFTFDDEGNIFDSDGNKVEYNEKGELVPASNSDAEKNESEGE